MGTHVTDADRAPRLRRFFLPIGVGAVDGAVKCPGGVGVRAVFGLLPGGDLALSVALPHSGREGGRGDLLRRQGHGLRQPSRVGQAAPLEGETVAGGIGAELCAGVEPGLFECVFIARGLALPSGHARGHELGGGAGQTGLSSGVASTAAVHIDLHVHHGDAGVGDQVDASARGFSPVLDVDGRVRHRRQEQADDERPASG